MFRSPGRGAVAVAAAFTIALATAGSAQAATYTVNSTVDQADGDVPPDGICDEPFDGKCTLRAAINESNGSAEADTIILPAGTFRIRGSEGNPDPNDGYWGDFDIRPEGGDLTIKGAGVNRTIISGGGIDRVFDVGPGIALTLDSVTVRDGHASTRFDSTFWGEEPAPPAGEDSASAGKPSVDELTAALPKGVSLAAEDACGCGAGGGVRVGEDADLTVVDSAISYNSIGESGDGGGIANVDGGDVVVLRSTIHRNSAGLMGGGISNGGHLDLIDSTVSENLTVLAGGGVSNWGTFQIDGSTINGNLSAVGGGGIATFGPAFDVRFGVAGLPTVNGETPVEDDSNTITNSTITDNAVRFGHGGALYSGGDFVDIDASTIADNTAVNFDLWRYIEQYLLDDDLQGVGRGAAIYATSRYDQPWWATGRIQFAGTIVGSNTDQGWDDNCAETTPEGSAFWTLGHNLDSGQSCGFVSDDDERDVEDEADGSDIENTDPQLDDLKDNGGPTYTRALLSGSPAIDAGGDRDPEPIPAFTSDQTGPEVDQRGGNRPEPVGSPGTKPDIGAYEANSLADLRVDSLTDAPDAAVVGKPLHLNVVVRNDGPDVIHGVKVANSLPAGAVASKPAACSAEATSCDLGDLAPGQTVVLETIVTPSDVGTATTTAAISAAGITDTDTANNTKSTTTVVEAAPAPQQQQQPQNLPPSNTPQQPIDNTPQDKDIDLNVKVPNTVTLNQFFSGIPVEADCEDEACLRRFREHAAINTGATHIAGFNLTVSRTSLGFKSKKKRVKLMPCKSGSSTGKRHKRCLKNLRKAAKKAKPFRVKIVVTAVDKAGNRTAQKAFITVK